MGVGGRWDVEIVEGGGGGDWELKVWHAGTESEQLDGAPDWISVRKFAVFIRFDTLMAAKEAAG